MSANGSSASSGSSAVLTEADEAIDGRRPSRLGGPPGPVVPVATAVRTRRRPALFAIGMALVALGSLAAVYLTQVVGRTVPVIALTRTVQAGGVLQRTDLTVAHVNADPALHPVSADRLASLIGQRAAIDLPAGSLLTETAVTGDLVPGVGMSVVGVALTPAQLPAVPLHSGDRVRIVDTPAAQGDPPARAPVTISGEVVSVVGPSDTGLTVVNVLIPTGEAADLAAHVATARVALVLDSRVR
jgi:hypothetical protein